MALSRRRTPRDSPPSANGLWEPQPGRYAVRRLTRIGTGDLYGQGTADAAAVMSVNLGNDQSASRGTPVAEQPSVLVEDNFGNPVAGVAVTFAVASGGGSVTDPVQRR